MDSSLSWILRHRALPFSTPPRRSTSPRTLSASTIRPTRSRPEQPLPQSRLQQNPRPHRLSRPLPSPSSNAGLAKFQTIPRRPCSSGAHLFCTAPLSVAAFLHPPCQLFGSGLPRLLILLPPSPLTPCCVA